jgi:riboflavin synthase
MFTGIVEELGTVEAVAPRLRVRCAAVLADATVGSSIAVNGVCLTAVEVRPGWFTADLSPETLRASNLGDLRPGARVNLERPLAANGRLSGHIVQGHVDGTGELLSLATLGDGDWWLRIRVPEDLDRFLVDKGSVAIDGISLTVAALDSSVVSVSVIPHTYRNTTLAGYRPGARVNVECDVLAKHVEKLLRKRDTRKPLTVESLRESGY